MLIPTQNDWLLYHNQKMLQQNKKGMHTSLIPSSEIFLCFLIKSYGLQFIKSGKYSEMIYFIFYATQV